MVVYFKFWIKSNKKNQTALQNKKSLQQNVTGF